jgi:hypothetical protein
MRDITSTRTDQVLIGIMCVTGIFAIFGPTFGCPRVARSRNYTVACIANLQMIDGAKTMWFLEEKKSTNDLPAWTDLVGTANYIREKPVCSHGGAYSLNGMNQKPTCTILGHTFLTTPQQCDTLP